MRVDIAGALAPDVSPGVSLSSLERLADPVATAHDRIETGRANSEHGYAALDLPSNTDPDQLRSTVEPLRTADAVLTVGIGGSALGAKTLTSVLGGTHRVLDNVDPAAVRAVLQDLSLDRTAVHVASRSGTTTETVANWLVVREALADAGVNWTERTIVTTGSEGPLRAQADTHGLPVLEPPAGVPGRFSVFSTIGLVPSAILGHDLDALLTGAQEMVDQLEGSLFDCPPYAYGTVSEALARRGASINAIMPYAESLTAFSEWTTQLWAESLGKDGLGQAPIRAKGVTDQHAQLQRFRDGPRNTLVTLIRPRVRPELPIPEPETPALEYLSGETLGTVIDTEYEATLASLRQAGRPAINIEIEQLDAAGLGQLLLGFQAACLMAGELAAIDAFDQPAVEWGKQATRDVLAGKATEAAAAVTDRDTYWIH